MENTEANTTEQIDPNDLKVLNALKAKKQVAFLEAEKYVLKHDLVELEHKNVLLQLIIKYKLSTNDNIDDEGNIIRNIAV